MRIVVVAALFAAALPAVADASTFVGGKLSAKGASNVTVRTEGERAQVTVTSGITCGDRFYTFRGRATGRSTSGRIVADGRGKVRLGKGVVRYRLSLRAAATGRGKLVISGRRYGRRCRTARLSIALHPAGRPVEGKPATPAASSSYSGLAAQPGSPPLAVELKVDAKRRVFAAWPGRSACTYGRDDVLFNYTPRTRVRGTRFERKERFEVVFADGVVSHYRVRFGGRFSDDGVRGLWRIKLRVTAPGRTTNRCSGAGRWHAAINN